MNNLNNEVKSMPTMRGDTKDGTLGRIDQYEIIRELGVGGFGVVYLVRDTQTGEKYAIKALHHILKNNPCEQEKFENQFKWASKLSHPNIVSLIHFHTIKDVAYFNDETSNKLHFSPGDSVFVMQYAPGVTLSKWRKQFPKSVVPVDLAIEICSQIALALDYAHSEKIIHRDITPSNIMIETSGDSVIARVFDFGLAMKMDEALDEDALIQETLFGTPAYMAPEQWLRENIGPAVDQYALASLFYEMVSGNAPFQSKGSNQASQITFTITCSSVSENSDFDNLKNAIIKNEPQILRELTPAQNEVLFKALSKNPSKRYETCIDFVMALNQHK